MKWSLALSSVLVICAVYGLLSVQPSHDASALPLQYNQSGFNVPFQSATLSCCNDIFVSDFNNSTSTAWYTVPVDNTGQTMNYRQGLKHVYSIGFDNKVNSTANSSTNATQFLTMTVASGNKSPMILVPISFRLDASTNHNNARIQNVTYFGANGILIINNTVTCGVNTCDDEMWLIKTPNTGISGHITITPKTITTYQMVYGAVSLYNIQSVTSFQPLNIATATATSTSISTGLTTIYNNSWLYTNYLSIAATPATSPTSTPIWSMHNSGNTLMGGLMQSTSLTAGSYTQTWTQPSAQWIDVGIEIVPITDVGGNFNLDCSAASPNLAGNGSKVFYTCDSRYAGSGAFTKWSVESIDVSTGLSTHYGGTTCDNTVCAYEALFYSNNRISVFGLASNNGHLVVSIYDTQTLANILNTTSSSHSGTVFTPFCGNADYYWSAQIIVTCSGAGMANDYFFSNANNTHDIGIDFHGNPEPFRYSSSSNGCYAIFNSTSNVASSAVIDNVACIGVVPQSLDRYWHGLDIKNGATVRSNTPSTLLFASNVLTSKYKKELTLEPAILGLQNPSISFYVRNSTGDYYFNIYSDASRTTISWLPMNTITSLIQTAYSRATQMYYVTAPSTDSTYRFSSTLITSLGSGTQTTDTLQPSIVYGPNTNQTTADWGVMTLVSGFNWKGTSTQSAVRKIDPMWTNDANIYPAIATNGTLFPVYLTVSNSPSSAGVMVQYPNQIINGQTAIYSVVQLDSTNSVEFDIPTGECVNIYVTDISKAPVWTYEGSICASGVNQKTMAYINTLPLNFWSLKYGVSQSWTPATNGLSLTFHNDVVLDPTYNVIFKNSTGAVSGNYTYTIPANTTLNTSSYNITGIKAPVEVLVYVTNPSPTMLVYSSYIGSSLSLSSISAFFIQNFSYQGFSLLSLIPIVFASMFTRNTVGIGIVLTVVCIASLSWFSIVVIPDADIWIMMILGVLSLIAYRIYYG